MFLKNHLKNKHNVQLFNDLFDPKDKLRSLDKRFKKLVETMFIQINNDKNFKDGLFVSLKICLHGSHILLKFHKKRIKLKTR